MGPIVKACNTLYVIRSAPDGIRSRPRRFWWLARIACGAAIIVSDCPGKSGARGHGYPAVTRGAGVRPVTRPPAPPSLRSSWCLWLTRRRCVCELLARSHSAVNHALVDAWRRSPWRPSSSTFQARSRHGCSCVPLGQAGGESADLCCRLLLPNPAGRGPF